MTKKLNIDHNGLSKEQLDLIQEFEADYNAVDQSLRKLLGFDKQSSFMRSDMEGAE